MKKHTKFDIELMIIIALYNLTLIGFALFWLFTTVFDKWKVLIFGPLTDENILVHFSYFFFAGVIGGSFYCLRALYLRLAKAYPSIENKKRNKKHKKYSSLDQTSVSANVSTINPVSVPVEPPATSASQNPAEVPTTVTSTAPVSVTYQEAIAPVTDPRKILNVRVWMFWYIYRPLQSGILSIILICLFDQGLIALNGLEKSSETSIFFQVGVGFLVGFGTHEVINKVEEVISVLFAGSTKNTPTDQDNKEGKQEVKQ